MKKSFLQSNAWEEFQKKLGKKTFRIEDKLIIKNPLVLNQSYLYSPRVEIKEDVELENFLKELKHLASQQNTFFARFEPVLLDGVNIDDFEFKKVKSRQPKQTLMLDLRKTEEEILHGMKQKARYNIRLAEKKGVSVKISDEKKDMIMFCKIAEITAKRDKIKFYDQDYYLKMLEALKKDNMIKIYSASYKNRIISSMIIIDWQDRRIYLHGASANIDRNVMSPYLLQWKAIRDAKKEGKKYYDFWGVAPLEVENDKFILKNIKHAWQGITRFKLGFAPTVKSGIYKQYPGCFEVSYGKKRYFLYSMFKKVV